MAVKKKKKTIYDKTDIYKEEIEPLVVSAMRLCVKHDIPFIFQCAVANDAKTTTYAGDFWLTGSGQINLSEDRFERYLAVMNGFETYWPTYKGTFDDAQKLMSGIDGKGIPESYETPLTEYEAGETPEDDE